MRNKAGELGGDWLVLAENEQQLKGEYYHDKSDVQQVKKVENLFIQRGCLQESIASSNKTFSQKGVEYIGCFYMEPLEDGELKK